MSDQNYHHGERLVRLETRMDNHDKVVDEFRKEQKWQTKQIFMGIGGLVAIVYVLDLLFKK